MVQGLSGWEPLARGGISLVWQASQLSLNRLVAVKVYQSPSSNRHRLPPEAAIAGSLSNHPGVVTIHDAGLLPDYRPYLIMELCPGGALGRWLKSENKPTEEHVRQVGVQIADALAAVHRSGVVHRDIKPGNILIDAFGNPRLADFGVATRVGVEAGPDEPLRITPAYAAPEVFRMEPATESSDVFSLAATLYALLAGCPPRSVGAAVGLEQLAEVATKPIDPLPWVDLHLMNVLMAGLSKDVGSASGGDGVSGPSGVCAEITHPEAGAAGARGRGRRPPAKRRACHGAFRDIAPRHCSSPRPGSWVPRQVLAAAPPARQHYREERSASVCWRLSRR